MRLWRSYATLAMATLLLVCRPLVGAADLDVLLRPFWDAATPRDAEAAATRLQATAARAGVTLDADALRARLASGRGYLPQPTGERAMPTSARGIRLSNLVAVPDGYDPARRWPVRVTLHGGVGRPAPLPGQRARPYVVRTPLDEPEIVLQPEAWAEAPWWTEAQEDNVLGLLDAVKRRYNVDESRVSLTGVSDGGTGVYYFAMRAATPWAACLPLIGQPLVLGNPDIGAEGQLHLGNVVNCPLYLVNSGRDRLYPAASMAPLVALMRKAGAAPVFHVYPEAGHDVRWWPDERGAYGAFLRAHPRVAHPDTVSWETDRTDRANRFRWLVVDRLGRRASDASLEDPNEVEFPSGRRSPLFSRARASGRVDVVRRGNLFEASTRGVAGFTLLLSPDVVDFAQPVQVRVNGRAVFAAAVRPNAATLLKWAARDNDRTMLYTAELAVSVP